MVDDFRALSGHGYFSYCCYIGYYGYFSSYSKTLMAPFRLTNKVKIIMIIMKFKIQIFIFLISKTARIQPRMWSKLCVLYWGIGVLV